MSKQLILSRFKGILEEFLVEMYKVHAIPDALSASTLIATDQIPMEGLIAKFTQYLTPYFNQIDAKDDNYFLQNESIFSGVKDKAMLLNLKELWPNLSENDKTVIWNYMALFKKCVEKYNA